MLGFNFSSNFAYRKYSLDEKIIYNSGDNEFEAGAGMDFMKTKVDFKFDISPELKSYDCLPNQCLEQALDNLADIKKYNRYRFYCSE